MINVKIYKEIRLSHPTMIVGWPGMGNVALGAVDFIRQKIKAEIFAEIDMSQYVVPDAVVVNEGVSELPVMPRSIFYYVQSPPVVIFEGETQVTGKEGFSIMSNILDMAQELRVKRIFTGAAFPMPVSYRESPEIYGVVNKEEMKTFLKRVGVKEMEGGQISGMNGLILGFARSRGIEAACLLATMPLYAISFPNPKSSISLVEVFARILNVSIDKKDMETAVRDMEEKMGMIEEKIKEIFPGTMTEEEKKAIDPDKDKDKIPGYVMQRIERLFDESREDKKRAGLLKEELDRWNLYELYEDRFLDLFKEKH